MNGRSIMQALRAMGFFNGRGLSADELAEWVKGFFDTDANTALNVAMAVVNWRKAR